MSAVVRVRNLVVRFANRAAVDDVSLTVPAGSTLGLVGESGSGKTTIARVVAGMLRPTAGEVLVGDRRVGQGGRAARRSVQLVPQDPKSSLNPRLTIRYTLTEALRVAGGVPRRAAVVRAQELLELVRLDPSEVLDRVPGELSGGQRQRIAIARAVAANPAVLVADEPTSALDVSVQTAVLDLLATLRRELDLTILFISHDLAVVNAVADHIAVLQAGRLVEAGPREAFFSAPSTEYARSLLAAVPRLPDAAPRSGPSTEQHNTQREETP